MSEYEHQYTDPHLRGNPGSIYPVCASSSPSQFAPPAPSIYGAADFGPAVAQWQTHASTYANSMRGAYAQHGLMNHPSLTGRFSPTVLQSMQQSMQQTFNHNPAGFGMIGMGAAHHAATAAAAGLSAGVPPCAGGNMQLKEEQHHHMGMQHRNDRVPHANGAAAYEPTKPKKPHIKKPLNAFMLFMKEMRAKVVAECTLKESAAINQILGRKWHALTREDQAKYYEMARKEKELHSQLYPGWSARDNYAASSKRKKKNRSLRADDDKGASDCFVASSDGESAMKKMRHHYAMMDPTQTWCRPGETDMSALYEQQKSYHHSLPQLTSAHHHQVHAHLSGMAGVASARSPVAGTDLSQGLRMSAAAAAAGAVASAYENVAASLTAQQQAHQLTLNQDGQITLTDLS